MYPTLMHEIARDQQADRLREAKQARLAQEAVKASDTPQRRFRLLGRHRVKGSEGRPSSAANRGTSGPGRLKTPGCEKSPGQAGAFLIRGALAACRGGDGAFCRDRRAFGQSLRVSDALVARHRDEVCSNEAGGGTCRGFGEHGGCTGVLGAPGSRILRGLASEQSDVVRALRDRERELGRRVERLADRRVAGASLFGPLDQRERFEVCLFIRLGELLDARPECLSLRGDPAALLPVRGASRRPTRSDPPPSRSRCPRRHPPQVRL